MHTFYHEDLCNSGEIILSEEESKHCIRVLRLTKNDKIELIDGKGRRVLASIIDDKPNKCKLIVDESKAIENPRDLYLHLAVAPAKSNERNDWFIEKAVETGIDEISFIQTKNCERSKVNIERYKKIAISAIKQSKQYYLPKINDAVKIGDFIKSASEDFKFVAWCEEKTQNIKSELENIALQVGGNTNQKPKVLIVIGPEGDFDQTEINSATKQGFKTISLGKNILRTETAALYVVTAANVLLCNK